MFQVDQVHECKRLSGQGVSIRRIAAQLDVSRNTVRRYLRGEGVPDVYEVMKGRDRPVVGEVIDLVEGGVDPVLSGAT